MHFSHAHGIAGPGAGPCIVPVAPRLCSAMVLAMNAYAGRFTLEHLAKVRADLGKDAFEGPLHEFVEAVLRDGSVEVWFAPGRTEADERT